MLNDKIKGTIAGLLIGSTVTGGIAFAKTGSETIEAFYKNIKIYVEGVLIDPKDANGNIVEPFIANGTTYLPVRAVGEALNKQVSWDGTTNSVYIGEKPGEKQYLMDVCPPYQKNEYEEYTTKNGKSFTMSGTKYTNGFVLDYSSGYALVNLNGNYSSMTLTLGHVDGSHDGDTTVNFYIDDELVTDVVVEGKGIAKKYTIPLRGGLQLKITREKGSNSYTGFGNITIE